jgi:hypothetical protein
MIPCRAIGGDFFDYLELSDGRIGFVLCDVSGKGPSAALMTAMIEGIQCVFRAIGSRYAAGFYSVIAADGRSVSSSAATIRQLECATERFTASKREALPWVYLPHQPLKRKRLPGPGRHAAPVQRRPERCRKFRSPGVW